MSSSGNKSSKVVYHPFFQGQQKKQQGKVSSASSTPPTPTPTTTSIPRPPPAPAPAPVEEQKKRTKQPTKKKEAVKKEPKSSSPPPFEQTIEEKAAPASIKAQRSTRSTKSNKKEPPPITKTTLVPHVPTTASGSKPRYTPIVKPKFYSDTLEYKAQKQHEAQFNYYGRIKSLQKKEDHEFSRLDRKVFGHAHVTQRSQQSKEEDEEEEESDFFGLVKSRKNAISIPQLIKNHQAEFFQLGKQFRSTPSVHGRKRSSRKMQEPLNNQAQLEAFLDITFPLWHTFSSCVILSQLVFNKSNAKTAHQQQQWIDKYRPKSVNGLLGERFNYVYLKDWLHQMKIEPMSAPPSSAGGDSTKKKTTKKKKKKTMHIDDDFNDLSLHDEDQDEDEDFMPIKKSAKQLKKESMISNIILLSGDHGVGKTASVYTAAEQLGYEVFEINSGSKRSGKEVMAMVGEMTKSHHVAFGGLSPFMQQQQKKLEEEEKEKKVATKPRKRKLNPYLSSSNTLASSHHQSESAATTGAGLLKHFLRKKEEPTTPKKKQPPPGEPKQSLILLEEVDLLFEEDKAFWSSIIELSQKSKRPIIMTCNDPDQVPFENLCLQVVLEMKPPSDAELLPYLWLLCFSEGYILDPRDLICFMAFLGRDIRQLIQTLELYVKNEYSLFEHYLGIRPEESLVDMKLKCTSSRTAVDTFRLARCYLEKEEEEEVDVMAVDHTEEEEDLYRIERALENNAFIDTWLGWKENGNLIHESAKDQINGFTSLWFEDDEESESRLILKDLESTAVVLNSERMRSTTWENVICEGSSRWDEICDAKFNNFDEYTESISKLLTGRLTLLPNEHIIMMEYIPFIQQMISADSKTKAVKTRSKRKRLYLPLNDEQVNILTFDRPIVDETEFWIDRLQNLKKRR